MDPSAVAISNNSSSIQFQYENHIKLDLVCRTCLNESNSMKSIFQDENNLCKMLQSCSGLSLQESDGFPAHICTECYNKVQISYEFRQQCEMSYNALLSYIGCKTNGGNEDNKLKCESTQTDDIKIFADSVDSKETTAEEFEIYKCRLCPNQYTTLPHLEQHFIQTHPEDSKVDNSNLGILNGESESTAVSVGEHSSNGTAENIDCSDEKFLIFNEPVSIIDFKDEYDDEENVDNPDDDDHHDDDSENEESDNSYENEMNDMDDYDLSDMEKDAEYDEPSPKNTKRRKTKSSDDGGKPDEPTTCTICSVTFDKKSKYYQHMEAQHKEVKLHQCDQCEKKFSRVTHLRRHQVTHLDVKPYPCEVCDKRFSRLDHKNIHMRQHSNVKPYKCDMCEKAFTRPEHLRRHRESRHGDEKPPLPRTEICEICKKGFTTPKYLQIHMKVHRAVREWTCKFCQKKFDSKQEHNDHQKVHVNERPFLCSECGLRFVRNDYLVIHMRRHKGEKPYKCKFCGKGFPRATDLTVHERYHTGEKTHLCTICGKGFQRAYNLLVHTRVHTGERPYKCPHCDKSFAQGNDLKAHVRRHTGERFKCDICGDGFIQGYHLTQHKRTQHGIDMKSHIRRVEKFTTPMAQQQRVLEQQKLQQQPSTVSPTVGTQQPIVQPKTEEVDTKSNIPKLTIIPEHQLQQHQPTQIVSVSSPSPVISQQQQQSIIYSSQHIPNSIHQQVDVDQILEVNPAIVKMEQIDEINQISTIMNYPN